MTRTKFKLALASGQIGPALAMKKSLLKRRPSKLLPTKPKPKSLMEHLSVRLGYREDNKLVRASLDALSTHLYCLGSSNSGKSRWLNGICRDIISTRVCGFCYPDMHGDEARDLLRFAIATGQQHRVIWLDPTEKWSVGINPLQYDRSKRTAAEQASVVMEMLSSIFGDENLEEKPQLSRWLLNSLTALCHNGYTLVHLPLFLNSEEFRWQLIHNCQDPFLELEWDDFEALTQRIKQDFKSPLLNRVNRFCLNPKIRNIFGQKQPTFDPLKAMNEGLYVLGDFSSLPLPERALIARSLIDLFFQYAQLRPEGQRRQFHLILDEFDQFASDSLGNVLAQCRKFGLSAILAHQSLENLKARPGLFSAVLSNCQMYATFRCSEPDAEILSRVHYTGEFRDDVPIPGTEVFSTKFRPVKKYEIVPTVTMGQTDQKGEATTESKSKTEGKSESETETESQSKTIMENESKTKGQTETEGLAKMQGVSESETHAEGASDGLSDSGGFSGATNFGQSTTIHLTEGGLQYDQTQSYSSASGYQHSAGENHSRSYQDSYGTAQQEAITKSKSTAKSKSTTRGKSQAETKGQSTALTKGTNSALTKGQSATENQSQALSKSLSFARVPITEYEEFQEMTSGPQLHTPESLKEYAKARVYNLPKRALVIKKGRQASFTIRTPDNQRVQLPASLEQTAKQKILKACGQPAAEVQAQLTADYEAYGADGQTEPQEPRPGQKPKLKISKHK